MNAPLVTAFRGHELLAASVLREVARVVWRATKESEPHRGAVLVFDDATGRVIDLRIKHDDVPVVRCVQWQQHVRVVTVFLLRHRRGVTCLLGKRSKKSSIAEKFGSTTLV